MDLISCDHHSPSLKPNPNDEQHLISTQPTSSQTPSKKRKVVQKTVVSVKIGSKKAAIGIGGKVKNEGPPPDFWSWRKYGQKPIKGSPYPRGYYRCSTTKGCSAKKQVERCKTDGSMFIITYTSSHNHPGPNISTLNMDQNQEDEIIQPQPLDQDDDDDDDDPVPNQRLEKQDQDHEKNSIIISPSEEIEEDDDDEEEEEEELEESSLLGMEDEEGKKGILPSSCSNDHELINLSSATTTKKSEIENHDHFFDELEELPFSTSSSLMRSSYFFDEIRISVAPS